MSTTRKLVWDTFSEGSMMTARIERRVQRRPQQVITTLFAHVWYSTDHPAMTFGEGKYVVTRNSFEDVRHYDTKEEAILYVESLFALESH